MIFSLAWKSLINRRFTAALTVVSIALSVTLLIGVERLRTEARSSFSGTISGTDLIVGARSGQVQLLLYSVFRIGNATNNISWDAYRNLAAHRKVAWAIPLSLGDSHRGYQVLGTTLDYFSHYRFARGRGLEFAEGGPFEDLYDVVLGAEVASALGYVLDSPVVVAHGAGEVSFVHHDDKPFRVAGILERTGTPVDRTLHVRLEAVEAIHIDWQNGTKIPGLSPTAEKMREMDLTPEVITAALLGLNSKTAVFGVQRFVNEYSEEPLTAVLPGMALGELWGLIGVAENALLIVSVFVVVVGLFGMLTALLTSLNERRREMAILRSVGARPVQVFALILGEAGFLTLVGIALGLGLLYVLLLIAQPMIESRFGVFIGLGGLSGHELLLIGAIQLAGAIAGFIPAYRAYRLSLADGLSIRV